METGSSTLHTYHSLFKFANPANEADGPGENGGVFGFCGDRNDEGDEPQLFKTAQRNCLEWKKVKISNDKAVFAAFYANKANENTWWTPTATPDNTFSQWGVYALQDVESDRRNGRGGQSMRRQLRAWHTQGSPKQGARHPRIESVPWALVVEEGCARADGGAGGGWV